MRTKKVTVHYCDHCKTRKFTRPAMAKHEKGCTANPDRVCGMCMNLEQVSAPLPELIDIVKTFDVILVDTDFSPSTSKRNCEELMTATRGCPACALAALRQSGSIYSCDFDWKEQSRIYWAEYGPQNHIQP